MDDLQKKIKLKLFEVDWPKETPSESDRDKEWHLFWRALIPSSIILTLIFICLLGLFAAYDSIGTYIAIKVTLSFVCITICGFIFYYDFRKYKIIFKRGKLIPAVITFDPKEVSKHFSVSSMNVIAQLPDGELRNMKFSFSDKYEKSKHLGINRPEIKDIVWVYYCDNYPKICCLASLLLKKD
jgi:hypothetical protein